MTPVVGAACAGRVAVWVTTSARFLRRGRFLNRELPARFADIRSENSMPESASMMMLMKSPSTVVIIPFSTVQPIPASGMSAEDN